MVESTGSQAYTRHLLQPTPLSQRLFPKTLPLPFIFLALLLVRLSAARWSLISDCDESYNYWEALHLVLFGQDGDTATKSFKTWEYDPKFAIRSWAYILPHAAIGWLVKALGASKLQVFYGIRASFALLSALIETRCISTVADVINLRCACFLFCMLACNAGLWSASVAFLPSSFTMYTTTLALSYAIQPSRSSAGTSPTNWSLPFTGNDRLLKATGSFALGTLLGWPFALVLSFPFVLEEVLLPSGNLVRRSQYASFVIDRAISFGNAALTASILAGPILLIDSLFYGKAVLVPLNIIIYNIMSAKRGAGPELYGVEPPTFYLANLALNAGPVILLLALGALPLLAITRLLDSGRFLGAEDDAKDHKANSSTALTGSTRFTLLLLRLAPFYLWLGLLSSQPHKEERFMFPAYTAMCLNAAVGLELGVGLAERAIVWLSLQTSQGSQKKTNSPSGLHYLPSLASLVVLLISSAFAVLRIGGTVSAYHAPFTVLSPLSSEGNGKEITGLFPSATNLAKQGTDSAVRSEQRLTICYGKEWYRFPNSLFLPQGVSGAFIKSEFDGILPKHSSPPEQESGQRRKTMPLLIYKLDSLTPYISSSLPSLLQMTRNEQEGFNDLNQEEWDRYVSPGTQCHLLVDSDDSAYNSATTPPQYEPRYAQDTENWQKIKCERFLDSEATKNHQPSGGMSAKVKTTVARLLWAPESWRTGLKYREYCLLANKRLMKTSDGAGLEE
jgi:alpha-1,2-mannosyltransferase